MSKDFLKVQSLFVTNTPITGVVHGCNGTCNAKVRAPALAMDGCRTYHMSVNYARPYNKTYFKSHYSSLFRKKNGVQFEQFDFLTFLGLVVDQKETMDLVTGYSSVQNCVGKFTLTACSLVSAIGEYKVAIDNNTVSLVDPSNPRIVAKANNTAIQPLMPQSLLHFSTLAGLVNLFEDRYMASVAHGSSVASSLDDGPIVRWMQPNIVGSCNSFVDPQKDLMSALNEVMFRIGVYAAQTHNTTLLTSTIDKGLTSNTTVAGTVTGHHNVFHTTYLFFIAAALVEAICVASILPTYWGWWTLGRAVSFSPFEIAKVNSCD